QGQPERQAAQKRCGEERQHREQHHDDSAQRAPRPARAGGRVLDEAPPDLAQRGVHAHRDDVAGALRTEADAARIPAARPLAITSTTIPTSARHGPPSPAAAFLTKPHQISRSEVYMRTETKSRPLSARSRKPRDFTRRASSRSSATRSRMAAWPPTSSYTAR